MKHNDLKEIAALLRERSMNCKQFRDALDRVSNETRRLKPLVGNPSGESRASWLVRAGITLILLPDPTITDLIGASMVAAGMVKSRTRQLTLTDTCREFQEIAKKVRSIAQELKY